MFEVEQLGVLDDTFLVAAGIERASRRGSALLIGHVQNRGVLAILRASAPALRDAGVMLSPLSEILDGRSGGSAR